MNQGLLLIGVPGAWENLCKICAIGDRIILWKEDASTIFSRGLESCSTFGLASWSLRRWQKQKARKQLIDVVTGCNCCGGLLCVWDRCGVRAAEQQTKPCQRFFSSHRFCEDCSRYDFILFYYAENEPWLVPAIANVKRKESWNMQLERLYQNLWLFFPLRLHLGYSVALLAIDWWDPWWSLHEKLVLPAPDVLFDLLSFPWGQFSRFIMDWSQGRTCRPNHGQLGYVTLWQERDGPRMEEEGPLRGPNHQTTCAQIHQIPHAHRRKWNPCPGQQHQHWRQRASWGAGWWRVHPPCLDELLWCCVPLSSCKLPILPKQLLAILSWP